MSSAFVFLFRGIALLVLGVIVGAGCSSNSDSDDPGPPTSQAVSLEYDPVGRLDRVEYTGGRTTTYEYDANGNVTGRRTTP